MDHVELCEHSLKYYYRQQTKLWEGNLFTPVYHSVHGGGGSGSGSGEIYLWVWGCTSPSCTPWIHTPGTHNPLRSTSGGTHPTFLFLVVYHYSLRIRMKYISIGFPSYSVTLQRSVQRVRWSYLQMTTKVIPT